MNSQVIDCQMLFDAIREKRNRYWVANVILMLDVGYEAKIRVAKHLLKDKDAFVWFMEQLEEDENESEDC